MAKKAIYELNTSQALKAIQRCYEQAAKANEEKITAWDGWYKQYLGKTVPRTQEETSDQLSSILVNKTMEKVHWMRAKMLQAIYNNRPIIGIVSRTTEFGLGARLLDEMVDYQVFHVPQHRRKFSDQITDTLVRATGIFKTYWDNTLYQPGFDSIPRGDIYIDPRARYIDEAAFVIHKFYRTREQLENSGLYDEKKLNDYFENADGNVTEDSQVIEQLAAENKSLPVQDVEEKQKDGLYLIWEFWTLDGVMTLGHYYRKTTKDSMYGMCLLRKKMGKDKPFKDQRGDGYYPFTGSVFNPKPHINDGVSLPQMIQEPEKEMQIKRNQAIDATDFAINKQAVVNRRAFAPFTIEKMERNIPGAIYEIDDPNIPASNAYYEIRKGDVPNSIFQEIAQLELDIESISGIYKNVQGQQLGRSETATVNIGLWRQADMLFTNIFESYAYDTLIPLYRRFVWLDQQFYKKPIFSSRVSPDGKTVEYDPRTISGKAAKENVWEHAIAEIQHSFDFELNISAIQGNKEMERAQLEQAIQLWLAAQPLQMAYPGIGKKLFKLLFATFDAVKNPEEMFREGAEGGISPEQQFQMAMGGGMGMQGLPGVGSMPPGFGAPTTRTPTPGIPGGMPQM